MRLKENIDIFSILSVDWSMVIVCKKYEKYLFPVNTENMKRVNG